MHSTASILLRTITTDAANINRWAILDSGATSHYFLTTDAPATNIILADVLLIARLPNGDKVQSMHTCTLDLPDLPDGARAAHIIPGLVSHSLLSVVTMCNAGCTVDKTPLAPLGPKALIYDDPASRASCPPPHITDGYNYYVGLASNHYQCLQFYIRATQRFHFCDT